MNLPFDSYDSEVDDITVLFPNIEVYWIASWASSNSDEN